MSDDAALLQQAVRDAGAVALAYFRSGVRSWEKQPGDRVSDADLAVNQLLHERLASARPDYGWLSEETADTTARLDRRRLWIVDPIDGTQSFLDGHAEFCVSVALIEDGRPVLAALFNPATDEFFFAAAGQGATRNGAPIGVNGGAALNTARLLGGKQTFTREGWLAARPALEFHWRNSVAYRLCCIAAGAYDGVVNKASYSDWDLAAADLVVAEAGGRATDLAGGAFRYNRRETRHGPGLLAAAPPLHAELVTLFASARAA